MRFGCGAALLVSLTSCSTEPQIPNDAPEVAEEPPMVGVETITATELAALIEADAAQLIDVRSPEEFASGHIAGAINIPAEALDPETGLPIGIFDAADVPDEAGKQTILYCRTGRRSEIAAEVLYGSKTALGMLEDPDVEPAIHLAGGIKAWRAAGLDTVKPD